MIPHKWSLAKMKFKNMKSDEPKVPKHAEAKRDGVKKKITTNGVFDVTLLLLCPIAAVIGPYESDWGILYSNRGNHVMHFRKYYWKNLVRCAINLLFLPHCHHLKFQIPSLVFFFLPGLSNPIKLRNNNNI